MSVRTRLLMALIGCNLVLMSGTAMGQFERAVEGMIRDGLRQIRGNQDRRQSTGNQIRSFDSIPGESGRENPNENFVPDAGWTNPPVRIVRPPTRATNPPTRNNYPSAETYPGRIIQEPGVTFPSSSVTYSRRTYPEPPLLPTTPNGKSFTITCPKSAGGMFRYRLVSPRRSMSLTLESGFKHTIKETEIWTIQYDSGNGQYDSANGTKTYRLRGGQEYVLRKRNGRWQIYQRPDSTGEPPVLPRDGRNIAS